MPKIITKSGNYDTMNKLTPSILDNDEIMRYIGKPNEGKIYLGIWHRKSRIIVKEHNELTGKRV